VSSDRGLEWTATPLLGKPSTVPLEASHDCRCAVHGGRPWHAPAVGMSFCDSVCAATASADGYSISAARATAATPTARRDAGDGGVK
jgi:hypothetical protein